MKYAPVRWWVTQCRARLRRLALCVLAGAASALALPPVFAVPVLLLTLPALFLATETAESRAGRFGAGFGFGFGFFAAGLYWIGNAFAATPDVPGALAPVAVAGLSLLLAVFVGFATAATGGWRDAPLSARLLAFAVGLAFFEWVRGSVLTGLPWNLFGTVWGFHPLPMQAAAVFGVYGLSLFTLMLALAPVAVACGSAVERRGALAISAAILAGGFGYGALRLDGLPAVGSDGAAVAGVQLRLVQPSIPQELKWQGDLLREHLAAHVELSRRPGFVDTTHVIWAETAVWFSPDVEARGRRLMALAAPPGGVLIAGAPRRSTAGETREVFNSLFVIDDQARVLGSYDKAHLVPFGEYVPFRDILPIEKITAGSTDFTPGPGLRTMDIPGLPPVSPLICYEIIFPGKVALNDPAPEVLINLTNDGWYGVSAGPYQHLITARFRAVEEGKPVIRAAYTGVSAVIDGNGRYWGQLPLTAVGVLDSALPRPLARKTVYAQFDNTVFFILLLCGLLCGLAFRPRSCALDSANINFCA